eukprot:gene18947-biopygen10297
MLGGSTQGGLEAHVHRVALRCAGQIGDGLGHRQLAFRAAQAFLHFPGGQAQAQRTRVGIADIFAGHAHHAPGQVQRVATAVDHPRKPVQRAVGVGAAHRFVQRGNLVVERFAALVETPAGVAQQALQQVDADFAAILGQVGSVFQQIEKTSTVAIRSSQQDLEAFLTDTQLALAQALVFVQRTLQELLHRGFIEALEHIDTRPGQQGIVQFKRRVFGGGTNKDQRAVFDIRQERILLRLVEAMHFVDEQDGALAVLPGLLLGDFHRLADLLDPGQHRRDRLEVCIRDFCQEPRQGGFTHARRPPENHRVQRTLLKGLAQRLAAGEQVFLPDVLVQVGRTQARRQRLSNRVTSKQVHGQRLKPLGSLFLDHVGTLRDVELELGCRYRLVGLDPGEQDIGALADAVNQAHVVDHAVAKRQGQRVKERVLGFRPKGELNHVAGLLGGNVEAVVDLRHIARQQQRWRLVQARVELLDGRLLQVRVPQGDFLAVRDDGLLGFAFCVPVEQPWALHSHLAGGFLQLGATGIQRELGEARGQGLGFVQQVFQAGDGSRVSMSRNSSQGQCRQQQHADKTHGSPLRFGCKACRVLPRGT